jgi:hypothetical protein
MRENHRGVGSQRLEFIDFTVIVSGEGGRFKLECAGVSERGEGKREEGTDVGGLVEES